MKRFHELTKEQQEEAIQFAKRELKDCLEKKIISSDRPLSDAHLTDFATCAAEDAWYAEPTDKVISDIAS